MFTVQQEETCQHPEHAGQEQDEQFDFAEQDERGTEGCVNANDHLVGDDSGRRQTTASACTHTRPQVICDGDAEGVVRSLDCNANVVTQSQWTLLGE
jgi:hypothetical protein